MPNFSKNKLTNTMNLKTFSSSSRPLSHPFHKYSSTALLPSYAVINQSPNLLISSPYHLFKKIHLLAYSCNYPTRSLNYIYNNLMDFPHDQNSNATRPSSNHFSENHFEPQTETSEHNPILSQELNDHQNRQMQANQQFPAPQFQSHQIANSLATNQEPEMSQNRPRMVRALSLPNEMFENEQNQQKNFHLPNRPQQQSQNQKKDQFLLGSTQDMIVGGYSLLNSKQPQEKMEGTHLNQRKVVNELPSQAETDLLDFGATLQEQIERQNQQIRQQNEDLQYEHFQHFTAKDHPMDIQSYSKKQLNEKQTTQGNVEQQLVKDAFQRKCQEQSLDIQQTSNKHHQNVKQELFAGRRQSSQPISMATTKREQNKEIHQQVIDQSRGDQIQEDYQLKQSPKKDTQNKLEERGDKTENQQFVQKQRQSHHQHFQTLPRNQILSVVQSHQEGKPPINHNQHNQIYVNEGIQPVIQTKSVEIQHTSQIFNQNQNLQNKVPTQANQQSNQSVQTPVQNTKLDQKKDELPSQIPSDEWQIIDDSINKKPIVLMQIESISGIKIQNNLVSLDSDQPIYQDSHPNQRQVPANSILDRSFIASSIDVFVDEQVHQQNKLASHQQFLISNQENQVSEKQNHWCQIKQQSEEWKIRKGNSIVNQIINIYERTDIYQPNPTPKDNVDEVKQIRQTQSRDSEMNKIQKGYVVEVTQCGEQEQKIQLSVVKNNDIYGCELREMPQSKQGRKSQEPQGTTSNKSPKSQLQEEEEKTIKSVQYQDEEVQCQSQSNLQQQQQLQPFKTQNKPKLSQTANEDRNQLQFYQHQQRQEQTSSKKPQQTQPKQWNIQQDQPASYQKQNRQQQITTEYVVRQLQIILQNATDETDDYRFEMFQCIIKRHVNLLFLKPNDSIGQIILQNGEYAIMFTELMVLNSPLPQERHILQKYLTATLSRNIQTNQQIYENYKKKFWPRKSDVFTQTKEVSVCINPQKGQNKEDSCATVSNYSIEVHDASDHQGPRSIMKSSNKQKIKQPRTEMPLKRSNIQVQAIKKARSISKRNETKQISSQFDRNKKIRVTKKRVTLNDKNLGQYDQNLGLAQTFVTIVDNKGKQVLQRVKVSRRLLQKSKKKEQQQKSQQKRKPSARRTPKIKHDQSAIIAQTQKQSPKQSRRKTINRSARKTDNENEVLNADYIKSHFQELRIDPQQLSQLNDNFLTQADEQIAKILRDYQKAVEQERRLILDLEITQSQPFEANEDYPSNSISMKRRQQLQKQLQTNSLKKYKIMQDLIEKLIVIQQVIDPDINGHGIYALVKVIKSTAVLCGARYFLVPMSKLEFFSRKVIDEDISTSKKLVEESERDNIGILKPSVRLQEEIEVERKKREKKYGNRTRA